MRELAFRVEIVRGRSGLAALAEGWRALFDALERPSYVQLWEWHRGFVEALAPEPEAVHFGALYDGEALVAVLPLVLGEVPVAGLRVHGASLPRHEHARHGDILVHPRALPRFDLARTLAALRARVDRPWDVTRLGPALEDSLASAAVGALPSGALRLSEPDARSDALALAPHEEFADRLSKNFRGALRKARNKLARLPDVRVIWARTPAEVEGAFARFLEVEASGWKGHTGAGTAIALDPALRRFYGELSRELAGSGRGRINLMMHGEKVMAGQFGIVAGERYFLLKIGYDESYRHEAPGNMLLERLIEQLEPEPELRWLDLVSDAAWHQSWKPVQREAHVHYVFHATAPGLAAWLGLRGKQLLRPMVRELRQRGRALVTRATATATAAASAVRGVAGGSGET